MTIELQSEISAALIENNLVEASDKLDFREIPAGVSSQLWLVTSPTQSFVVKQPLAILRSSSDWRAPLERGYFEYLWLHEAQRTLEEFVPKVHAYDERRRLLVMSYYDNDEYRTLKELYLDEDVRPALAFEVGAALARVHSDFGNDPASKSKFDAREVLALTRLDPYFLATADRHPDLADIIHAIGSGLMSSEATVIHGDISPKNILIGPVSPVFLDAECACVGDPSFDVAFFMTHLFLKCVIRPNCTDALMESARAFLRAYADNADPTLGALVEENTASFLGVFLLARVDGKSPVEYLTVAEDADFVRQYSRAMLQTGKQAMLAVIEDWAAANMQRAQCVG